MGGWGSGRWKDHTKAQTVEESLVLDIGDLVRKKILPLGSFVGRPLEWTYTATGEKRASVWMTVDTLDPASSSVLLKYETNGNPREYRVRLDSSRTPIGGTRWWWRCPRVGCGRRVAKLYLPPSSGLFLCRTCHALTYTSAQEHDARVDRILRFGNPPPPPGASDRAKLRHLLLTSKALTKGEERMKRRSR